MALARVLLHEHAHGPALRVEHREPGADLVREREEVELHTELAVVALLRLLEAVEVLGERVLALPRGAVDALELRPLLVAAPVRAGDAHQLERAELAGRRHVRTAAQVDVGGRAVGPHVRVDADGAVAGHLVGVALLDRPGRDVADDLELERLVGEQRLTLLRAVLGPHEGLVLLDDLAHARLDAAEVVVGEVLAVRQLEVVVEAVGDRRSDRVLGAGEQVEDRLGHEVGGGVPEGLAPSGELPVTIATAAS